MMCVWRASNCFQLSWTSHRSLEQRPINTKIGTEVAHVTRNSDTAFKVKRSTCRGLGHIVAASRSACYIKILSSVTKVISSKHSKWSNAIHITTQITNSSRQFSVTYVHQKSHEALQRILPRQKHLHELQIVSQQCTRAVSTLTTERNISKHNRSRDN